MKKILVVFALHLMFLIRMMHSKCRGDTYPLSNIKRLAFADKLVPWFMEFEDYNPPEYEAKVLLNKPWADPPIGTLLSLN